MSAIVTPSEQECYLLAIIQAADGLDLAEFAWYDPESPDGCYRAWDFQFSWYVNNATYQIDQGGRALGKALALNTPVPTPTGWTTMGQLHDGDQVFDDGGQICTVTHAHPALTGRPCYQVTFSDGTRIVADEDHLWETWTRSERKNLFRSGQHWGPQVRTTADILKTLTVDGESNHSVDVAGSLLLPDADLEVEPYVLGVAFIAGRGVEGNDVHVRTHNTRQVVVEEVWDRGYVTTKPYNDLDGGRHFTILDCPELVDALKGGSLPIAYLRASVRQRRDLLAGMMDAVGTIRPGGRSSIPVTTLTMASDVKELLVSLGEQPYANANGQKSWLAFRPRTNPALRYTPDRFTPLGPQSTRVTQRRIISIRQVASVPVRCITVDSPSSLYLVSRSMVPTHNTVGIKMRAAAFPFAYEGQAMLVTAPELNHLRPLTDAVEKTLLSTRLLREMLPDGKGKGVARQPHWQVRFRNGTSIVSRLPNKDGRGVKGCLGGGTLITTAERGQVPIEDVKVGDWVLTHAGRYRPVRATYSYSNPEAVVVAGGGHRGLVMSESHSMWARRHKNPQRSMRLDAPAWLNIANAPDSLRHYLASPLQMPFEVTAKYFDSVEMLRVAGRYVADGNPVRTPCGLRGICITDDEAGAKDVIDALDQAGFRSRTYQKPSLAQRIDVDSRELAENLVEHFGERAEGKKLPMWLLGASFELREAFLLAYLAGDGHFDRTRQRWQAGTASKALAIGLRLLGQSLGYAATYSWVDPKVTHICGVQLKKPPQRSHRVTLSESCATGVHEDGFAWQKIRSVKPTTVDKVYDLDVADDHSYIADGLVSHNQHVINIELDEAQDYPAAGWTEVVETLNAGLPGAMWRCHGVSKGIRDKFFEKTQPNSGWIVHRPMAMHRPTWSNTERQSKIVEYGGSRQSIDYRRNIYGEHGDASASVFVLAKLMACVDLDEGSVYNQDVYANIHMEHESFPEGAKDDERLALIHSWINLPGNHKHGYSQKVNGREVGAPNGYSAFWGGMDVGVTNHPSELLVFGQRTGSEFLELLTRINMQRINTDDQMHVVSAVMNFYGKKIRLGIDKTGVGFPIWDRLTRQSYGERIYGFGFSEKRIVAFEDRELVDSETIADLALYRNVVEAATDWLRSDYVDTKRLRLPYDREVLIEFQGQTYTTVKASADPYGTQRKFSGGSFHTLDAAKIAAATKHIPPLENLLNSRPTQASVLDEFIMDDF